jgi:hypothetical protein
MTLVRHFSSPPTPTQALKSFSIHSPTGNQPFPAKRSRSYLPSFLLNILDPDHPNLFLFHFPFHLDLPPPPNLVIHLSINRRSCQLRRQLIPADDEGRVCFEESIDVFEAAVGGFRVEEVGYWDEGEADYGLLFVSFGLLMEFASRLEEEEGGGSNFEPTYPDDPELVA